MDEQRVDQLLRVVGIAVSVLTAEANAGEGWGLREQAEEVAQVALERLKDEIKS